MRWRKEQGPNRDRHCKSADKYTQPLESPQSPLGRRAFRHATPSPRACYLPGVQTSRDSLNLQVQTELCAYAGKHMCAKARGAHDRENVVNEGGLQCGECLDDLLHAVCRWNSVSVLGRGAWQPPGPRQHRVPLAPTPPPPRADPTFQPPRPPGAAPRAP